MIYTRKIKSKPIRKHDNLDYDPLRKDKKRIPSVTSKEWFKANQVVAQKMLKRFCWRAWMEDFIDHNGTSLTKRRI